MTTPNPDVAKDELNCVGKQCLFYGKPHTNCHLDVEPTTELEQRIEEILAGVEPGEVRVSHPDGRSVIMSTYQLAAQDIIAYIQDVIIGKDEMKPNIEGSTELCPHYDCGGCMLVRGKNELRAEQRLKLATLQESKQGEKNG